MSETSSTLALAQIVTYLLTLEYKAISKNQRYRFKKYIYGLQ